MLKKLKALFDSKTSTQAKSEPTQKPEFDHLSPISHRIKEWLDSKGWNYEHNTPSPDDELRTHHFIVGFRDESFYWNCVIYIHEKNQLVSFQGLIMDDIEPQYYLPIMAMFSALNFGLGIGSFEFDVMSATVRTKIGLDAEFCSLSDNALGCYLHNLAGLTEQAYQTVQMILSDPNPNQDLLAVLKEQGIFDDDNGESSGFYLVNDENRLS